MPCAAVTVNPRAAAAERFGGALGDRVVVVRAGVHEHAELVAAHPVRGADPLDGLGEVGAERARGARRRPGGRRCRCSP